MGMNIIRGLARGYRARRPDLLDTDEDDGFRIWQDLHGLPDHRDHRIS